MCACVCTCIRERISVFLCVSVCVPGDGRRFRDVYAPIQLLHSAAPRGSYRKRRRSEGRVL